MNASITELRPRTPRTTLIGYINALGVHGTVAPEDASGVEFSHCLPVRGFAFHNRQKHTPGWYWSTTNNDMLAYESRLERSWLVIVDRDPDVVRIATQPMEIDAYSDGVPWRHIPDMFIRYADGGGEVIDVKHPSKLHDDKVTTQARRTAALCKNIGWSYRLVGEPPATLARNLDWLAGYRRPMPAHRDLAARLLAVADRGVRIDDLCAHVGDDPAVSRAVVYHLLWTGALTADLHQPLRGHSLVESGRQP